MTRVRREILGLQELHRDTSTADRVRALLAEADTLNEQARQNRIQVGKLLAELRSRYPRHWRCGLTPELAQRLIQMAESG